MKSEKLIAKPHVEKQHANVIQAYDSIIQKFNELGYDEQYLNCCRIRNLNVDTYCGVILFGKLGVSVRNTDEGVRYDFFVQPKRSVVSADKFQKAPPPKSWLHSCDEKDPVEFVAFVFEYLSNKYFLGTVHARLLLHAVLQTNPTAVAFLKQLQAQGVMQRHHIVHMFTCHLEASLKFLK